MIKTSIALIAFPDEISVVERVDLRILMQRAERIEARMEKGVNIEDEYRRYQTYCDRLEYYGNLLAGSKTVLFYDLGPEYEELLLEIDKRDPESARRAKIYTNYCSAESISSRLEYFRELTVHLKMSHLEPVKKKIEFYETAKNLHLHVLEIHQVTADDNDITSWGDFQTTPDINMLKIQDEITRNVEANAENALRTQFRTAINNLNKGIPGSVNVSDLGHYVITKILNEMVYSQGKKILVPVIYADGSEAAPFPVNILNRRSNHELKNLNNLQILNVGMMAGRHDDLDRGMHFYWLRNQEISTGDRAAEIDMRAYRKSKELLQAMRKEGSYRIAFFQTGFQPVVMGFYRALAEELLERRKNPPTLMIIPQFVFKDETVPGKIWA